MPGGKDLLMELDRYFDAAPRSDADAFDAGAFTLFVGRGPWSYYARPRHGAGQTILAADVEGLGSVCREHDVGLAIEWVHELTPSLELAARSAGLEVERHVLLVLAPSELRQVPVPEGVVVELLVGDDPRLAQARAVADVAFGAGGTAVGGEGPIARESQLGKLSDAMRTHLASRSRRELTITAVASGPSGVLASGALQPAVGAGEIVAVATLPVARRNGLAAAVTAALVREAARRELGLVLLSAESDAVARVYERCGFVRVGTHAAAARPD